MCVLGAEGGQRGIRSSATGAIGSCEPPCGCWTLSLGPLQEQEELLTVQPIRKAWVHRTLALDLFQI